MSAILGIHSDPLLVRDEVVTDLLNGDRAVFVFECISSFQAETKKTELLLAGATTVSRRSMGNGNWEVTATWTYDPGTGGPSVDPPQSIHEIDVNIAQPDFFSNLILLEKFTLKYGTVAIGIGKIGDVQRVVAGWKSGKYKDKEAAEAAVAAKCPGFPTALELFRLTAFRNVDCFIRYDPVYKRTVTAATPLQVQASFVGDGKIWTSAEVEAFEGLPNSWWFSLPADYQWLKSPPNVQTVVGQKTQISYSYTGAKSWTVLGYEPYQSALLFGWDRII